MIYILQLLSAVILDLCIGDPPWLPHPVCAIGRLCTLCENITRRAFLNSYLAGTATVFLVLAGTGSSVALLLYSAALLSPVLGVVLSILLLATTIAIRDLLRHSNAVYLQLIAGGSLERARTAISMIVGRDTKDLNREGVIRACIETVAENMVDGITAPLFYAVLVSFATPFMGLSPIAGSVFGAFLYKAINTMDSMIGYKNEKYLQFGKCAAKLDDTVNFFPARISGLCMIPAAFLLKLDYREASRIFWRDRLAHASPNAGHTEAATAGALGLRLGGPSRYFGEIVEKSYLGDGVRPPVADDIIKTHRLVLVGTLIFLLLLISVRLLLAWEY